MAIRQLREAVEDLLCARMAPDRCGAIASQLSEGRYTHDYAITPHEARSMGLEVSTDIPEEVMELMTLYPQPVRRQSAVEFLPGQRRKPSPGGEPDGR